MDTFDFQFISQFKFLTAFIAAVALFFLLRLLFRFSERIVARRERYSMLLRLFPAVETLVWLIFLYWAAHFVLGYNPVFMAAYLVILAAVGAWFFWFALRDIIAGVVLQLQDVYRNGQEIRVDNLEGVIRKVGKLGLELEQADGERIKIPYSRISGNVHTKIEPGEQVRRTRFSMAIPRRGNVNDVITQLRFQLLTMPWIQPGSDPNSELTGQDTEFFRFEIQVQALSEQYGRDIETYLREQLNH
jgi:small-conductance mechanosensitive channel